MEIEQYHTCPDPMGWTGLYRSDRKYQKYRVQSSNAHPAKMSMSLANKIMIHLEELNLVNAGTTIVDFMAGQGTTGIVAELHGHPFIGIELEQHFIDMINGYECDGKTETTADEKRHGTCGRKEAHDPHMYLGANDDGGQQNECDGVTEHTVSIVQYGRCRASRPHDRHHVDGNRDAVRKTLNHDPKWKIIRGDARELSKILSDVGAAIVSHPYGDSVLNHKQNGIIIDGTRYDRPYMNGPNVGYSAVVPPHYGNISNLTDVAGIASPPYSQAPDRISAGKLQGGYISDTIKRTYDASLHGNTDGQIGNLKDVAGVVSPPYANRMDGGSKVSAGMRPYTNESPDTWFTQRDQTNIGNLRDASMGGIVNPSYESTDNMFHSPEWLAENNPRPSYPKSKDELTPSDDNVASTKGETYLSAMLKVYSEAYRAGISPLVIVTKNPTKNGKLRRLDLDTVRLLQMAGYKIVDYHRAILFEIVNGVPVGRISFFKRLSLQNGNVAARWEDVIFCVRDERDMMENIRIESNGGLK